ncbi:hypothetical protein DdX_16906 [Ditylenchus destructor]|uniref:Uncharacterized protein n=1 Tax=Ditylenchus destructor TaxID=166010 RepID=A0AAD4MN44_9BILA|nr:hypothetical protein DdX_16906 [Ditylenchus destructor]
MSKRSVVGIFIISPPINPDVISEVLQFFTRLELANLQIISRRLSEWVEKYCSEKPCCTIGCIYFGGQIWIEKANTRPGSLKKFFQLFLYLLSTLQINEVLSAYERDASPLTVEEFRNLSHNKFLRLSPLILCPDANLLHYPRQEIKEILFRMKKCWESKRVVLVASHRNYMQYGNSSDSETFQNAFCDLLSADIFSNASEICLDGLPCQFKHQPHRCCPFEAVILTFPDVLRCPRLFLFHNRQWGGISAGLCEHSICSWLFYKKHNVIDDDRTFICDKVFLKTLPEDVFNGISEKFLNETIAASFAFILVHIPSRDAYLDMYPPTWKFSIVEEKNNIRPPLLNMLTNEKLEFLRCRVSLFGNQLEADVLRRSRIAQ